MLSIEIREQAANEAFKAVFHVAELVQDSFPMVTQYYEYFVRRTRVAFPNTSSPSKLSFDDYGPLLPSKYDPVVKPLFLISLYEEDAQCGQSWERLYIPHAHAGYNQFIHACIVQQCNQDDTRIVLGVSILHELYHAVQATEEGREGTISFQKQKFSNPILDEERGAYDFQRNVVRALNPDAYDKIIERHIRYLEERIPASKRRVDCPIIPLPLCAPQMDAIYGPAKSQKQSHARHGDFVIMSYLTAFERWLSKKDVIRAWRAYLLALYEELL